MNAIKNSLSPRVVLTFDDTISNHESFVAPLLLKLGLAATFYITEFAGEGNDRFDLDKRQYMDWQQIALLHEMGFEIGNHTWTHPNLSTLDSKTIRAELETIEQRCETHSIPRPVTFAYPGSHESIRANEFLQEKNYIGSRSGGNRVYRPGEDSLWSIPGFGITEKCEQRFYDALALATGGETVVYIFHGVPDYNHPWVNNSPESFTKMMEALARSGIRTSTMKELVEDVRQVRTTALRN